MAKRLPKLSDVIDLPDHLTVIDFHRRQKKLPSSPEIEMLKLAHRRPDRDGIVYSDFRNFLDPTSRRQFVEIPFGYIDHYIFHYKMSGVMDVKNAGTLLMKLADARKKKILKYILAIDKIFRCGISINKVLSEFKLFRFMSEKMSSHVIHTYSSWSIFPLTDFCHTEKKCYLYIIEKSAEFKILYLDDENNEIQRYEYEILLPRGVTFKVLRQHTHLIADPDFRDRGNKKRGGKVQLTIINIEITGIKKLDPKKIKLPRPRKIKFTSEP